MFLILKSVKFHKVRGAKAIKFSTLDRMGKYSFSLKMKVERNTKVKNLAMKHLEMHRIFV